MCSTAKSEIELALVVVVSKKLFRAILKPASLAQKFHDIRLVSRTCVNVVSIVKVPALFIAAVDVEQESFQLSATR
jgi:hypothetical protein